MRTFFAFVGAGAGFSLGALIVNKVVRLATDPFERTKLNKDVDRALNKIKERF